MEEFERKIKGGQNKRKAAEVIDVEDDDDEDENEDNDVSEEEEDGGEEGSGTDIRPRRGGKITEAAKV